MTNFIRVSSLLLFIFIFSACNISNNNSKENLDLSETKYNFNINFSSYKYPLGNGVDQLANEFTNYIYNDDIKKSKKIDIFKIRKDKNNLLINYPVKDSRIPKSSAYFLDPYEEQKITCRSKKCVGKTFKKIIGDGERDVNIEFDRKLFKVEIKYTYQDC